MKKKILIIPLFCLSIFTIKADDLEDLLQDLAVQTACLVIYSTAETGEIVTSRYDDPIDWYKPSYMANRFAEMSGNRTGITMSYGICFEYAQFAWDDIFKYQKTYNDAGMKGSQWYIAAADAGDPYTIILYDPVPEEQATIIRNGVYLKEDSRHKVLTHGQAEGHAWLWVQHNNGTWYWIDPTWTDNTGWVHWGIVQDGKEVEYYPNPAYCEAPDYPRPGETEAEKATRDPRSTYATYQYVNNEYQLVTDAEEQTLPANVSPGRGSGAAYSIMYIRPLSGFMDFSSGKWGLSVGVESAFFNYSLDWLSSRTYTETGYVPDSSFLFGVSFGYPLLDFFMPYIGGGLGVTLPDVGNGDDVSVEFEFAWKVNGGLRFRIGNFLTKIDVSYGTILDTTIGIGLGFFL